MKPWYNNNDCEHLSAYYAYYPVQKAAMLWCRVPPSDLEEELSRISAHPQIRGVWTHPFIPCFEVRCKLIHSAIERGVLSASRENGVVITDHIRPERRHVSRENLKAWIAKEHPSDKPPFLFDEIERSTHAAINADSFRALQADRDAARTELEKAKARVATLANQLNTTEGERDSLRAIVDKMAQPSAKAETTYLNIIGGLLGLMLGKTPSGQKGSIYGSQEAIISALLGHYNGKQGISPTTLENKFAEANRSIKAT